MIKTRDVTSPTHSSDTAMEAVEDTSVRPLTKDDGRKDEDGDTDEEDEEAYYSDSDGFVTLDESDSDTIENSGDSDSAIGSESFCVNPFFN
jgi:hypothetical protein